MSEYLKKGPQERSAIPANLTEPLRRLELAVEWFRAGYPIVENPTENRLLHQQLAEMKRQIAALEAEFCRGERCG